MRSEPLRTAFTVEVSVTVIVRSRHARARGNRGPGIGRRVFIVAVRFASDAVGVVVVATAILTVAVLIYSVTSNLRSKRMTVCI
jgi:hypothetical protein